MTKLATLGFDADDTLWHHERYYQETQRRFEAVLAPFGDADLIHDRLVETERRNLLRYGYGVKGFTLSMIETALELTEGRADGAAIREILALGHDMLAHPIEPLPHVRETLAALSPAYRLVLITKGDLFDQERKLAESGLGDFFHGVEIVSEKTAEVYVRVFARHGQGAECAAMIGNSLKSDIVPALAAGAYGIHVPSDHNWVLDHHGEDVSHPRFHRVAHVGEAARVLEGLGEAGHPGRWWERDSSE